MSATKPTRAQRVEQVAQLADRLGRAPLRREIAADLGVSISYAAALVTDPTGEGDRERKKRYAGVCEKCGGPTTGSNGRTKAPTICLSCLTPGVRRERIRAAYPIWNEEKCLDAIVRWVERNQRIPRVSDLLYAEHGERPCMGTIIRHCYRYETREEVMAPRPEWGDRWREPWTRSWTTDTRNLHDILVDLAPRFPSNVVILTARNATLRSRLFEVIGVEEVVRDAGEQIASDEWGVLWRVPTPPQRADRDRPGEPYVVVQVVNSTPEPDGSFKDYFLRVPPDVATPRAAIAWTFGVAAQEYELAVQT